MTAALLFVSTAANTMEISEQTESASNRDVPVAPYVDGSEIAPLCIGLPTDPSELPQLEDMLFMRAASVECNDAYTQTVMKGTAYVRIPAWMPAHGFSYNCYLERWSENRGVAELQYSLKHCNGQQIAVDGVYGPATEQAVKNVQYIHGLYVDDVYGPATGNAMKWKAYNSQCIRVSLT